MIFNDYIMKIYTQTTFLIHELQIQNNIRLSIFIKMLIITIYILLFIF